MFVPIRSISNISKKLLLFGTFLMLCISGYGQDLSIEDVTEDEDVVGGNMVFTVTLNGTVFLGTSVTYSFIDVSATGGIDYDNTVGPALNFSGFSGETEIITVPITDDLIDEIDNEDFIVQLGTPTNGVGLSGGGDARGRIRDNDTAGVLVSTTTGTTTEAGGQATFTFTLTSQPTADVTILIDGYDATETTGPATITLTSTDWNTGVDLIVIGVDDDIIDGNIQDDIRTQDVASLDPFYDDLDGGDVADLEVTNQDLDFAGVVVTPVFGTTNEAGGTATFNFTLTSEPSKDVTIPITGYDLTEVTGDPEVVLDSGNWNTGVDLIVTGVDDNIVDGDTIISLITGDVTSDDNDYDALLDTDVADISVTNADDDVAGYTLSTANLGTTENGPNGTFTVVLTSAPVTNVVISATSGDTTEGIVSPTTLTFTTANYNTPRTVTVTPVDDPFVDGPVIYNVTMSVVDASSDNNFDPLPNQNVSVTNADDDVAGYTLSTATLGTTENGPNGTFTVVLTSAPVTNVVISATSGDTTEGTVSPAALTFTPANYNTPRTVTVTPVDDPVVDGPVIYNVTMSVVDASSDNNFDPLPNQNVSVTNADDDIASLSISDAAANENAPSGTLIFNVVLSNAISGGTTVTYAFANGTATGGGVDFNSTGGSITFDGTTGEIEQIVVPLINDSILEDSENFTVQLGTPSNGVIILGGSSATGTINDDDNCASAPILDTDVQKEFCDTFTYNDGTPLSLNDYTNSTPPPGKVLTWSRLSDPLNTNAHLTDEQVANPPNDGSYFGFFYDETNNCASGTIEVELTLNSIPVIAETLGDERCGPGEVTLTAMGALDVDQPPTFNWYDSMSGGISFDSGSSISLNISATTSYYVEAEANGCVSERVAVTATVYPLPSAGTSSDAFACNVAANGPTIADLDDLITGESAGVWSVTTDPSGTLSIGIGNIVSFEDRPDGDYVFTYTTTDATSPFCENVSADVTITVNDCDVDTDSDGLLDGIEIALGTDPNNADTDGDGFEDAVEVGDDTANPLDEDADGIIDALDSNILDTDMDGVVDQLDPANTNPCVPDPSSEFCVATVDLEITKTTNDDFLNINEQLTFTITVTNISDEIAAMVQVEEVLDAIGFDYISHFTGPGDGVYDEVTGLWDIPMLETNASATLVILVEAISFGEYVNTATIIASVPIDNLLENNEASVDIVVNERSNNDCGFLFNQFSPNSGDAINNFLFINCIQDYPNNSIEIYDRYGNQVFEARPYDNTWDGTRNNNDLPKGTYFYVLDLEGDGTGIRKGWIQIIRQ